MAAITKQKTFPSGWKTKVNTPCPLLAPCATCKQLLPVSAFYTTKRGRKTILGTSISNECPSCSMERYRKIDPRLKLLYAAKQRANASNLEFSLTIDDIVIPEHCPVLGVKLFALVGSGRQSPDLLENSPSLDRINNALGYTPDNVRVVSRRANFIKGNMSPSESAKIMSYIAQNPQVLTQDDIESLQRLKDLLSNLNLDHCPGGRDSIHG